jgi:4-hydroxythreonine-4-phosphate dehydrogenase
MVSDLVRIGLVTTHLPIKEVAAAITVEKIVDKGTIFHTSLRRDFRISSPRIAILALNPQQGIEEEQVIKPAVEALEAKGIQAFGPYVADEFFGKDMYYDFDGVLAMYHDQGQTPFKAVAYENGVRFTTGLDLMRTDPAHGVNCAAAGKNITDEQSLRNAIYVAIDVWRNRQNYDEPYENPLPKLYHERRDESEKVRFHKKPEE